MVYKCILLCQLGYQRRFLHFQYSGKSAPYFHSIYIILNNSPGSVITARKYFFSVLIRNNNNWIQSSAQFVPSARSVEVKIRFSYKMC